ncbi:hypothetical protein [Nocardiopsis sp. CC223A]|uniref:hypothetical protein n=1 Tax=Nocardiopsis sp. CC223A TaxID=3044051 RepID=UPI00278C44A9|nr:hypothetical protein [Nocardiopsis sp. CC223A]
MDTAGTTERTRRGGRRRSRPTPRRRPGRLGPRTRKAVLIVHIAASGAWLGLDLVLGILVVTALLGGDGAALAVAAAAFATWPMIAVGALTLASGVVLGLGSRYGLVRYKWVLVKLVLNVVLVLLVVFALSPAVGALAEEARAASASGGALAFDPEMLFPPVVSSTAVAFAIAVSVTKPWGPTTGR